MPLVVDSDASGDRGALLAWIEANHAMLEDKLHRHGALLFRGFPLRGAEDFERVALAVDPRLRHSIPLDDGQRRYATRFTYSAASYDHRRAAYNHLAFHFEDYYLPTSPTKIMFYCVRAPAAGGETVIVDGRKVYDSIPPETRDALEKGSYANGRRLDVAVVYENAGTRDKAKIEDICRQLGVGAFTWETTPGARPELVLRSELPRVRRHEATGEPVWFNALMQRDMLGRVFDSILALSRVSDPRLRATTLLGILQKNAPQAGALMRELWWRRRPSANDLSPRAAYHVARAFWKNAVAFRWQDGDVLVVENHLVAHGRMPHLGARELLACTTEAPDWVGAGEAA